MMVDLIATMMGCHVKKFQEIVLYSREMVVDHIGFQVMLDLLIHDGQSNS